MEMNAQFNSKMMKYRAGHVECVLKTSSWISYGFSFGGLQKGLTVVAVYAFTI